MIEKLHEVLTKLQATGVDQSKLIEALTKIVNSPLLGFAVKLSPNQYDDLVLEVLKSLFPAK
jgi:restriction endonuclease Mrr